MIRAIWFELLPERTWENWFWLRVSKVLRERNIRGTDLGKVRKVAMELDKEFKEKISALSRCDVSKPNNQG